MALSRIHPVEIGSYGKFTHGGLGIVAEWMTLEHAFIEAHPNHRMPEGSNPVLVIVGWALYTGLITSKVETMYWLERLLIL